MTGGIVSEYDTDDSNDIETDEVRTAISDFVDMEISGSELRAIKNEWSDSDGISSGGGSSGGGSPSGGSSGNGLGEDYVEDRDLRARLQAGNIDKRDAREFTRRVAINDLNGPRFGKTTYHYRYDLNDDGTVDVRDVNMIRDRVGLDPIGGSDSDSDSSSSPTPSPSPSSGGSESEQSGSAFSASSLALLGLLMVAVVWGGP